VAESSKEQRIFCGRLTQHLNPTFAVHRPQWREGVEGPALMGPNSMFGNFRRLFARQDSAATVSGTAARAVIRTIPLRRLWWAAILLIGVSASAVIWTIWQLRADAIGTAVSETGNIASVLADQLSRSLKSTDTVLLEIKRSMEAQGIESPAAFQAVIDRSEFPEMLANDLAGLPQVFSIAIADREGQIAVSTVGWTATRFNVSGRDFFWKALARRDGQLTISIPAVNRINDKQTIVFSRRLEDSKGNFVGIVLAGVNTKYFEDIYGAIQSVHSLLFTLLDPGGIILFRHPDGADAAGKELSNKAAWLDAVSKGDAGFRVFGQADGNIRYVSIRKVPEYPLIVDISVTEVTALAIWRQRAAAIGLGSAILLLLSVYLLRAITRQVRLLSNSEASLAQKSQQLDAALNNMSQGVAMFDGQQRLIISNTQLAKIYRLTPEQTKPGTSFRAILDARAVVGSVPQDVPNFVTDSLDQVSRVGLSHSLYELRRAHRCHQPSGNGRRRVGFDSPGHHGAKKHRSRARASGAPRCPDRPRPTLAVYGKSRRSAGADAAPWRGVLGPDARPRPLQDRQRLVRPPGRRRAVTGNRPTVAQHHPRGRLRGEVRRRRVCRTAGALQGSESRRDRAGGSHPRGRHRAL
jgi:PAS domain-containing protein